LLYIYLPIRASTHPPLNWGSPDTRERFVEHITAKNYQQNMISLIAGLKSRLIPHLNFFTHQFNIWLIPLSFLGFIFLLVKKPRFGAFLLLIATTNLLLAIRYDISNIEDYYIPSFLLFSLAIGSFLHYTLYTIHYTLSKLIPNPYSLIPKIALCLLFLALPILQCRANYPSSDHSDHYIAYDYGRNILKIEEESIVFVRGDDWTFPAWYLQNIEQKRLGAAIINIPLLSSDMYSNDIKRFYPYLTYNFSPYKLNGYSLEVLNNIVEERMKNIVLNNLNFYPIYLWSKTEWTSQEEWVSFIPQGVQFRVVKKSERRDEWLKQVEDKMPLYRNCNPHLYKEERIKILFGEYEFFRKQYCNFYDDEGLFYLENKEYDKAILLFNKALSIDSNYFYSNFNLGKVYCYKGLDEEAYKRFKKALEIDPKRFEPHYYLGFIYGKRREYDKAIKELETVLKIDSNNIQARQDLAILRGKQ
jgi:tetratricopeptide (TPR) repeat protein